MRVDQRRGAGPRRRSDEATAGATVLVVDDEPLMRSVMKRILVDEGYVVLTASNPAEALALADTPTRPDLVLTDLLMPGMDGVELARRLHALWPETSFVFMSAMSGADRLDERESGVVLEKPFEIDALASCVREALARGRR
jgi:CheY-like chemotaxis protein